MLCISNTKKKHKVNTRISSLMYLHSFVQGQDDSFGCHRPILRQPHPCRYNLFAKRVQYSYPSHLWRLHSVFDDCVFVRRSHPNDGDWSLMVMIFFVPYNGGVMSGAVLRWRNVFWIHIQRQIIEEDPRPIEYIYIPVEKFNCQGPKSPVQTKTAKYRTLWKPKESS